MPAVLIDRTRIQLARDLGLRGGQALWRRLPAAAHQGTGIEMAQARIIELPVFHPVERIARLHHRGVQQRHRG